MGVVEGFEVFDEVVLLELADGGEDGWLDLHKICKGSINYKIWNMGGNSIEEILG